MIARSFVLTTVLALAAAAPPQIEKVLVRTTMRDGVRLSANVFRRAGSGRQPVILIRTPYGKGNDLFAGFDLFVHNGYTVVVQDVRGRGQSEGRFRPMTQEVNDGDDTIKWVARQPWSNGRVGMVGGSYLGFVQWEAALSQNPSLKAIATVVAGDDGYFDRMYSRGGGFKLGHRLSWMAANMRAPGFREPPFTTYVNNVPLRTSDVAATGRTVPFYQDAMNHPAYDAYWRSISTRERINRVQIPAFIVGGWYDNYAEGDLDAFSLLHGRVPVRVLIGPWPHNTGERFKTVELGPDVLVPLRSLQLAWLDQWVKGTPDRSEALPVRIFVMGLNKWRDEREWPLARTRYTPFYLTSDGHANTASGDGALSSEPVRNDQVDRFTYDPRNVVPTTGGSVCCSGRVFPWGPMDQRRVEARGDVLVYTSETLTQDVEVTGPVRAVLHVSTSAPDTDFMAKLVDVHPDGRAINLCDGMLRLRYRSSLERVELARASTVYRVTIQAGVTSNLFRAGHRIRVEISSSNFPRFDRNPNTGRPVADDKQVRPANQTVYHDRQRPSYILLPVIPPRPV